MKGKKNEKQNENERGTRLSNFSSVMGGWARGGGGYTISQYL